MEYGIDCCRWEIDISFFFGNKVEVCCGWDLKV